MYMSTVCGMEVYLHHLHLVSRHREPNLRVPLDLIRKDGAERHPSEGSPTDKPLLVQFTDMFQRSYDLIVRITSPADCTQIDEY